MNFFGTRIALGDPALYLVAWATVTLVLVAISTKEPGFAVGTAATVLLSVAIFAPQQKRRATDAVRSTGGGGGLPTVAM